MKSSKSLKLWMVNVVSFFLFCLLGFTGLMNWMVLPRGFAARGGFAVTARHFLADVHAWTALAFVVTIVIHIMLHWPYVKHNLKK